MIILVSRILNTFDRLNLGDRNKIAFIPNAKDKSKTNHLDKYRIFFKDKGYSVNDVDLRKFSNQDLYNELIKYDIIYVAGGNTFYLLQMIRESGFDRILKKLLNRGIVYIGESAGACIMGSSIEPMSSMDDPELSNLKDYTGLEYLKFVFIPHYKNPEYDPAIKEIEKKYSDKFVLKRFTETQGLIIRKGSLKKLR